MDTDERSLPLTQGRSAKDDVRFVFASYLLLICFSLPILEFNIWVSASRSESRYLFTEVGNRERAISMQPYKELTDNAERQIMELRQRARGDPRRRSIYYNWANDVLARWMKSASSYANTEDDLRNLQDLVDRFP